MPAIDKPKAEELLAQLQQHQANQAQCLRNLLGLPSENAAEEKREAAGKVMGGEKSPGMSSETAGTVPKISRDEKTEMPADWALPWSNALLRKRIDERRDEPGCAGDDLGAVSHRLHLDLSDVDAADPAVRFITANALTDLTRFTFERDFQFLQDPSDFDQAFSVTDFDEKRQITLDTRTNLKLMKDKENELQRVLFSQVSSLNVSELSYLSLD
ncbi:uncharacterized protein KY384_007845 [Bacidia gigantensis]|uniref:uncharacterized protein n=1 Tax=Bacidia gigantensis TaxID=2732470 RepID=UPI001D042EBC|nr:uncharacterized protein KY384_007845 [Bacidia gigantensis]KAG8527691.1 hypothetical protein KY384_007845 [Bacidia gigantensis]